MNKLEGYNRESLSAYLKELEQEIAKFEAIENKRPSDIESLKILHAKYEEINSQLSHDQAA